MSVNTPNLDNNDVFEFNYSHDICPTCQDLLLIVESELEGCEARKFCACCDLVALNVSAKGMKSKSWWRSFWMMISFSPQEWRMNTSRHLKHKRILSTSFWSEFCVDHCEKVFVRKLPGWCCLKVVRSLLKIKHPNEEYTGFKPFSYSVFAIFI